MENSLCKNTISHTFIISKTKYRRGIAPVIATLLLVAISTIGGSMVFAYSQDSFSTAQISDSPNVELIKIIGFDARDVDKLSLHDGNDILAKNCCGIADGKKNFDERIAIYLQNDSIQSVVISELRFAGEVYSFTPTSKIGEYNKIGNGHKPHPGEYIIVNNHIVGKNYETVQDYYAVIQPGEIVTIILDLDKNIGMFHDSQVKITTTNGNSFVSTLVNGQGNF
jgi:hypothetical protein